MIASLDCCAAASSLIPPPKCPPWSRWSLQSFPKSLNESQDMIGSLLLTYETSSFPELLKAEGGLRASIHCRISNRTLHGRIRSNLGRPSRRRGEFQFLCKHAHETGKCNTLSNFTPSPLAPKLHLESWEERERVKCKRYTSLSLSPPTVS